VAGSIELLAGDAVAAEREFRVGLEMLEEMGERDALPTQAAGLAEALSEQGRDEEAERYTRLSEQAAAAEDTGSQVRWRLTRAVLLARAGDPDEADRLVREAIELAERTDCLDQRADALRHLGDVLDLAGRPGEAGDARLEALALYEEKANEPLARRMRDVLATSTG
jgi:tetratricopeptide (TPR) repeat protein